MFYCFVGVWCCRIVVLLFCCVVVLVCCRVVALCCCCVDVLLFWLRVGLLACCFLFGRADLLACWFVGLVVLLSRWFDVYCCDALLFCCVVVPLVCYCVVRVFVWQFVCRCACLSVYVLISLYVCCGGV